jgi:hypothetical protein
VVFATPIRRTAPVQVRCLVAELEAVEMTTIRPFGPPASFTNRARMSLSSSLFLGPADDHDRPGPSGTTWGGGGCSAFDGRLTPASLSARSA